MKQLIVLLITFLIANISFAQDTLNVLFVGNSYTNYNGLRNIVSDIATSQGNVLTTDQSTPGGYTLEGHTTNTSTQDKIAEGDWDFVTLQEQSQKPSFSPSQVSATVYPFATELVNDIRAANPCAEPLFFMTWGRENGDQSNCQFYEPLCTYEGMQERLTQSYNEMAVDNNAMVSPVGEAWRRVRATHPDISLYTGDGSHPNVHGSYLAACVFYSMMFGESMEGDYFVPDGINIEDAEILRSIADETVFDEMETWNFSTLEVTAAADYTLEDNVLTCTNNSMNETMVSWDFGDGNTSMDDNPEHSYTTSGAFTVICTVSNECTSDLYTFDIYSIVSDIENLENHEITISPNPFESEIKIEGISLEGLTADIFDATGKKIQEVEFSEDGLVDLRHLTQGVYFLKCEIKGLSSVYKIVKN